MNIRDFIREFKNHPVLFIGAGLSLRYLENSHTWDSLLQQICFDATNNDETYLDIKSSCQVGEKFDYPIIGSKVEEAFNQALQNNRNGQFKNINDQFYKEMANERNISRFKLYISELFKGTSIKPEMVEEINEFKKARKNIGSVITTNYDTFIEAQFDFTPLVGNDIMLSNPYGAIYKIHGCITDPQKIIINQNDYDYFHKKYELIRAQMLSLFIHNPIIFLGYSITDENIKSILKTIFTYVEPNSDTAEKIRKNFLLVEYEKNSNSTEICEHDIDIQGYSTIRINKIKTDNFSEIYNSISDLHLPVSAMDVRKVQNIVGEIYAGGSIRVSITEDIDSLNNNEKILAIGSKKSIQYTYQDTNEIIEKYFKILEEENIQLLNLIDKIKIQSGQWFPIFEFSRINQNIKKSATLRNFQMIKINNRLERIHVSCKVAHSSISEIYKDENISQSKKDDAILWCMFHDFIPLAEIECHLADFQDKRQTCYKTLLCFYDLKKHLAQ